MINIKIGNSDYVFYDNIKETPEIRWQKAQIFIAHESSIGSTMESVNKHYEQFFQFIGAGKIDMLQEEANNLYFSWNSILNSISYKSLCLSAFIFKIDGELFDPKTDEAYYDAHNKILEFGITSGMLDELIEQIKKKLMMK